MEYYTQTPEEALSRLDTDRSAGLSSAKVKEHAEKYDGGSVNAFITRAIKETMERDKEKTLSRFKKERKQERMRE